MLFSHTELSDIAFFIKIKLSPTSHHICLTISDGLFKVNIEIFSFEKKAMPFSLSSDSV